MSGEPRTLALVVRLARLEDTPAVVAFTRDTWDGWDYVPGVWPAWLAAPDGLLLVAEAADRIAARREGLPEGPLAVARLALLTPGEAWLEGLRVHRAARGRGIATTLQIAELRWAVAQGATVVRYATGDTNEASHRLGARHGFRDAGRWRGYGGGQDEADADPAPRDAPGRLRDAGLVVDEAPQDHAFWWARLQGDSTFRRGRGLYECRPWAWQALTTERLAAHARAGELLGLRDGERWALGVVPSGTGDTEDPSPHFALLAGDPALALGLATEAQRATGRRIRLRLPEGSALVRRRAAAYAAAGFAPHEWAIDLLARPLAGPAGEPLPLPEAEPGTLVYGDPPAGRELVPRTIGAARAEKPGLATRPGEAANAVGAETLAS